MGIEKSTLTSNWCTLTFIVSCRAPKSGHPKDRGSRSSLNFSWHRSGNTPCYTFSTNWYVSADWDLFTEEDWVVERSTRYRVVATARKAAPLLLLFTPHVCTGQLTEQPRGSRVFLAICILKYSIFIWSLQILVNGIVKLKNLVKYLRLLLR